MRAPGSGRYIYAIVDGSDQLVTEQRGFDGAPLHNPGFREIGAVVSRAPLVKVEVSVENVTLHECIVESLAEDHAVLPVRFGTILSDDERVLAMLEEHYGSFVERLDLVRGKVEMGLRVLWRGASVREETIAGDRRVEKVRVEAAAASAGRRYLLRRLEEELVNRIVKNRAELLAAEINAPLLKHAAASRLKTLVTPSMVIDARYLVDKDKVEAFGREVERVRSSHLQLGFLSSGPWPAYSFCEGVLANDR